MHLAAVLALWFEDMTSDADAPEPSSDPLWNRTWEQDRYSDKIHRFRSTCILRSGISGAMEFPIEDGLVSIVLHLPRSFPHLLRPSARRHYAALKWQPHISICKLSDIDTSPRLLQKWQDAVGHWNGT